MVREKLRSWIISRSARRSSSERHAAVRSTLPARVPRSRRRLEAVAERQLRAERLELGIDALGRPGPARRRRFGAHRDRRSALRRQINAFLERVADVAICAIGTFAAVRGHAMSRDARSRLSARFAAARAQDLDQLVALAILGDGEPGRCELSTLRQACDETPSTRALFWSMSSARPSTARPSRDVTCGMLRMRAQQRRRPRRRFASHPGYVRPTTRNCTGNPTGGPFSTADARGRAPAGIRCRTSRAAPRPARSRSSVAPSSITTNCAKFASGEAAGRAAGRSAAAAADVGDVALDVRVAGEHSPRALRLGARCAKIERRRAAAGRPSARARLADGKNCCGTGRSPTMAARTRRP